ncbi:hypothetical protein MAR_004778 [Mya arenaria]|uniref:Uncharacterized protein n=1 Tax=Mya arenaria TaxID=6604 RepID=A0ABY7EXK6_MYAAR|nr:hypothetical protein MAR_004778 [Mya arenaria]
MGNLISHFQSPQADTADSGTESAGTNRRIREDSETRRGHSGYSLRCTRATQYDEEDLVENFRSEIIKAKINRRLIPNTHTMLYDTVSGSLMFHLKWTSQAWRQLSVERLREVLGKVVNILMEEGSKEDIESQTWNVEVCTIPNALNVRPSTAECDKRPLEKNTLHSETSAGVQLGQCTVVKEKDTKDANQKEKFADTIGYESFLTTIRRYIFCGSKDRLKSERLEPKQIPTDDSADNDNDVKIFRGRNNLPVDETSFQDEGYFTIKIDKQSKQEKL